MNERSIEVPEESQHERRYRALAVVLILLFPVAYVTRWITAEELQPKPPTPRFAQLVVLTVGEWPEGALPLTAARARSASIEQTYAPALTAVGSAVSLWTGRYPMSHGVRGPEQRLPEGSWTLASAARSVGTHTSAFLQEQLISASGLEGFDRVVEDPALTNERILQLVQEELGARSDERVCVWLHLAKPSASELSQLRQLLFSDEFVAERGHESLVVLTGFRSSKSASPDERARVPLFVELPGGTAAGLASTGSASLVDLAGLLRELLTLPAPGVRAPALQSRGQELWRNLNGGGSYPWLFLEGAAGDVLRFGRTRVAPTPDGALAAEQTEDPRSDTSFRPAAPELAAEMIAQYQQLAAELSRR